MNVNNALISLLCTAVLFANAALAAEAKKEEPGPVGAFPKGHYGALDKLPDWGGVWVLSGAPGRERPALKGKYLELNQEWQRVADANKGVATRVGSNCLPPGLPGIMAVGQYPSEFLFTPGRITIQYEAWMQWRVIFTDGRPHPPADEWEPTFYGHSIGHWEGDTLIVDTVGIKDTVPLQAGMTHSDKLHIAERMYLAKDNPDTLVVEVVAEDPLALQKPWNQKFTYRRERSWNLVEFICAENDRNPVDESGQSHFEGR